MKETVEELLARRELVNLERLSDNTKAISVKKGSEFYEDAKKLIPQEDLEKRFALFFFDKGALVFIKAYSSISDILDDGWDRADLN